MATLAFVVQLFALAASIAAFVWQVRDLRALPVALEPKRKLPYELPPLSVVIVIEDDDVDPETCLLAALAQDYPEFELVVVDGRGPGRAGRRLDRVGSDPRLRFAAVRTTPAGWAHRPYLSLTGARQCRHSWILFIDSTVLLRENAFRRIVQTGWWHGTDLLVLIPEITATTRWERLLMPFIIELGLLVSPSRWVNDPERPDVSPNVPLRLFKRQAYAKVGGHAAVRGLKFDDTALEQRLKASGRRLVVGLGVGVAILQTQTSLATIWRGWAPTFNAAISNNRKEAVGAAAALIAVFALPWLLVPPALLAMMFGAASIASSPWTGVLVAGATNIALAVAHRRLLSASFRLDDSLVWLQPVAATVTAAMLVASTFHSEGGLWSHLLRRLQGSASAGVAASQSGSGAGGGSRRSPRIVSASTWPSGSGDRRRPRGARRGSRQPPE